MINQIGISVNNYSTQSVASNNAAPKSGEVEFSYNSQDQFVKEPGTAKLSDVTINKNGPATERVTLSKTKLEPNADGSYVFDKKEKGFTGAHTFATVNKTLDMFENACGSKVPWATRNEQIKLVPDGGEMLNAYYSRNEGSLNFFHAENPATKEMIFSGNSGEVVSHEVGHAMLDGLRPGYLQAWSPDPGGFHESFADCMGMFMATQDDATCEIAAQQTGGDMKKPNCLAATGEELGKTINDSSSGRGTGGNYIRNAINDFKWQDPSTLPDRPKDGGLGTEMHSWSRLYTGAIYDVFSGVVDRNMSEGMSAKDAIKDAGQQMISLYGNLMKEAPKGDFTYEQMANCMIKTDGKYCGGKNTELLRDSFTNRKILPEGQMMASDVDYGADNFRMMSVKLDGEGFGMFSGAKVETPVSGMSALDGGESVSKDLKTNMQRLIQSGRILYTEPNQTVQHKDLFDKDGMPYMGVVRWVDGEMTIERNHVIN